MAFNFSPKIVTDGLVLCLDAANSKSIVSGSTTWNDLSRGGNNGNLVNGPTFNSGNGGSILFDGVDDYVSNTFKALDIIGDSNPFSISAFFKTNITTQQLLICCPDFPRFYIEVFNRSGTLVNHWGIGGVNNSLTSTAIIDINQIYNYVVTYDGNVAKGYLNGILKDTDTIGSQSYNTNSLQIGKFTNASPFLLSGSIYTTQIYNKALSSQEVLQNYNATKTRFGL